MSGEIALGKGNTLDDQLLLLSVEGVSPEEASRRLGGILSPARVRIRTAEILKAPDWLTAAQQEQAVFLLLRRNLTEMRDAFIEDGDKAKIQLSYIKEIFSRLDKRQAATDEQLSTYHASVGRQLGRVVDMTLSYMKGALRSEVDPVKWDELVQESMQIAWLEIEKNQIEES